MPYNESESKRKIREIRNSTEPVFEGDSKKLIQYEVQSEHFQWLLEQAEKYQKIEQSWKKGVEEHKETIFFLRTCKEVIEGFKIETRKRMS